MNQKEATYTAVVAVCGQQDGVYTPTKEQRTQVSMILFEGFRAGKIQLDREFDDAGLKTYISGLVSNWLRKDTRLNGGSKYQAKKPGSRAGSTDPQLKAMRALMSTLVSETDKAEVQAEIDKRIAEIKSTKTVKSIDFMTLPEALRLKFQKQ